jgi:predicted membrane protein
MKGNCFMNPANKAMLGLGIVIAAVLFYVFVARSSALLWVSIATLLIFHAGIFMILHWFRLKLKTRRSEQKASISDKSRQDSAA